VFNIMPGLSKDQFPVNLFRLSGDSINVDYATGTLTGSNLTYRDCRGSSVLGKSSGSRYRAPAAEGGLRAIGCGGYVSDQGMAARNLHAEAARQERQVRFR
jgi:hypothetical protein